MGSPMRLTNSFDEMPTQCWQEVRRIPSAKTRNRMTTRRITLLLRSRSSGVGGFSGIATGRSADRGAGPFSNDSILIDIETQLAAAHGITVNINLILSGSANLPGRSAHSLGQLLRRDAGPGMACCQHQTTQEQLQESVQAFL